jgi:hypothetical protein
MAIATQRMFFNADKTKLVDENDPDAVHLAAAVGDEIPEIGDAESDVKGKKATDTASPA